MSGWGSAGSVAKSATIDGRLKVTRPNRPVTAHCYLAASACLGDDPLKMSKEIQTKRRQGEKSASASSPRGLFGFFSVRNGTGPLSEKLRRAAYAGQIEEITEFVKRAEGAATETCEVEAEMGNLLSQLRPLENALSQKIETLEKAGETQTREVPVRNWRALLGKLKLPAVKPQGPQPNGSGQEILFQAFNWESHWSNWYQTLEEQSNWLAEVGFTTIWLPPPTDSVSRQGYMPRDLYCLDSQYGNESELRSLIKCLHRKGFKVMADIVLNHRCAHHQGDEGVWNKFGGKLDWDAHAIISNDPNFRGRGNHGHGEIFGAAPNIDHSQDFVRRDLSEWLVWLRKSVGFDGWRFDFVHGFDGHYIKEYVQNSEPFFSVGEYWDSLNYDDDNGALSYNQDSHRQRIINWMHKTGDLSSAFDITTKGILHAVFERTEYWRLRDGQGKPPGLLGWWKSRAVTFLENHDTGSTQGHWRFPEHGLEQGYVYILTHPGTPTVFYDHFVHNDEMQNTIIKLIKLRKQMGLHCRSSVNILQAESDVYAAEIDSKLLMKIGPGQFEADHSEWQIAEEGSCWKLWSRLK